MKSATSFCGSCGVFMAGSPGIKCTICEYRDGDDLTRPLTPGEKRAVELIDKWTGNMFGPARKSDGRRDE